MRSLLVIITIAGCTGGGLRLEPSETADAAVVFVRPDAPPISTSPALANCALPEGPQHAYSTLTELGPLALGQWVRCAGFPLLEHEQLGLEFDADGTYYMLGDDGQGGVVKLVGFGKQGTWEDYQEGTHFEWILHPTPNSGGGGPLRFEDDPQRFALAEGFSEISIYARPVVP